MDSSPTYDYSNWTNAVASIMMFLNSFLGIFFNVSIIYNFLMNKNQKTSFNFICTVRAFNNIYILLVAYLGVFLPITVLGYSFYSPLVESFFIASALNFNLYNEYQSIYMTINRFVAIYFPLKYDLFFGFKVTVVFHILHYIYRIYGVTIEMIGRNEQEVYLLFNIEYLAYGGLNENQDKVFFYAIGLTLIPFCVNIFTFLKFYHMKKRTSRDSENWRQAKKNMVLFAQTVFQDSIWPISVVFNLKLNVLIRHRFWTFFCQTFVWQCLHVLDGLIMFMFNDRIVILKKKARVRLTS